jgi:hypothetical protein
VFAKAGDVTMRGLRSVYDSNERTFLSVHLALPLPTDTGKDKTPSAYIIRTFLIQYNAHENGKAVGRMQVQLIANEKHKYCTFDQKPTRIEKKIG